MAEEPELIDFFGTECTHCHAMDPIIERVEKETGKTITKLEIWHNAENAKIMAKYDKGYCGGVPFFINTKTGKWICGEASFEKLRDWALGK